MNHEQKPKMPSVTNVLMLLLDKAQENLTPEEINFLTDSTDVVISLEIDNLKSVVSGIAGLVREDKMAGNFRSKESVSDLMYSIAHQLDVISGLSRIKPSIEMYQTRNPL